MMSMLPDLERLHTDAVAWDEFVASSSTAFPLQMSAWAEAKRPLAGPPRASSPTPASVPSVASC